MAEEKSLVRKRRLARFAAGGPIALILAFAIAVSVGACAPTRHYQSLFAPAYNAMPAFHPGTDTFVTFDGAPLGLSVWHAEGGPPEIVVVGLHGMGDYANTFHLAAPFWAKHGVTTYAYDQRAHGRSPERGVWPKTELLLNDLRTAVDVARTRHPEATLAVVGVSMGGAVAMSAFGSDDPPAADRLILSGPGLRGWGALPFAYKASLWMSTTVRPRWVVRPPKRVARSIMPSDNIEMLRALGADPWVLRDYRIDAVYGVVSLMELAHKSAPKLPADTLVLYGAKDQVIPPAGVARTASKLPDHVRTAYYAEGYHMLLRDLQADRVWSDILSFVKRPEAPLPSKPPALPWGGSATSSPDG